MLRLVASVRHFFARGNTARGVHCLYDSAFQGLKKLFLLVGDTGSGKSTLLRRIADEMLNNGQAVELFHSPLNPDDLDALIIPSLQIGVADEQNCPGVNALSGTELVQVDLGPSGLSAAERLEFESLHTQSQKALSQAYDTFAAALRIHDEWEAIYIGKMDFAKADQVGQELIESLIGDRWQGKQAAIRHLFFGAATPKGAVDHILTLTDGLSRRIYIKGRPGSGKSTLLKRLAATAEERGFDVEVFHCGFDPNSLDMLIFPELSLAIFDSTAPHEYFPTKPSDEVLDMYERAMEPGTDAQYASELAEIQQRYAAKMREATAYLQEAQRLHGLRKAAYAAVMDFAHVDEVGSELLNEMLDLATK